jgi:hypothetical protein
MSEICKKCYIDNDYPVDMKSNIPPELRGSGINSKAPTHKINGGLYCGDEEYLAPWMPIPVVPTTTYFMSELLKSANPPPGAQYHYPTQTRSGNNYTATPGVYWFNSSYDNKQGPYSVKVLKRNKN